MTYPDDLVTISHFSRRLDKRDKTRRKAELARNLCRMCDTGADTYISVARNAHNKCLQVLSDVMRT